MAFFFKQKRIIKKEDKTSHVKEYTAEQKGGAVYGLKTLPVFYFMFYSFFNFHFLMRAKKIRKENSNKEEE